MFKQAEGRHFVPRGWSRRRKVVVGSVAAVTAAGVGIAWALLALRTPLVGGGDVVAPAAALSVESVVVLTESQADCTVSHDGTTVTIQMAGAVRGAGSCDIRANLFKSANPATLRVSGVDFADATTEALINGACGTEIGTTATAVDFRLSVPASAPLGPFTASAATAGLNVTDQPVSCP